MKTIHTTPLPAGEGQGGGALWASSFDVYIQKKRTTRITRTGLSKNNVTLIILNHAKTAIGPKNNNIIFTLKSIKLLT